MGCKGSVVVERLMMSDTLEEDIFRYQMVLLSWNCLIIFYRQRHANDANDETSNLNIYTYINILYNII